MKYNSIDQCRVFFVGAYHVIMLYDDDTGGFYLHSLFHNDGTFRDIHRDQDELRVGLPDPFWGWLENSETSIDECFCKELGLRYVKEV